MPKDNDDHIVPTRRSLRIKIKAPTPAITKSQIRLSPNELRMTVHPDTKKGGKMVTRTQSLAWIRDYNEQKKNRGRLTDRILKECKDGDKADQTFRER